MGQARRAHPWRLWRFIASSPIRMPTGIPANPRHRRAIIIGGSIATHLKLLEAMGSIIERFGHATMVRPLGEGVQTIGDYDFH
jgi:hypothetical protein